MNNINNVNNKINDEEDKRLVEKVYKKIEKYSKTALGFSLLVFVSFSIDLLNKTGALIVTIPVTLLRIVFLILSIKDSYLLFNILRKNREVLREKSPRYQVKAIEGWFAAAVLNLISILIIVFTIIGLFK